MEEKKKITKEDFDKLNTVAGSIFGSDKPDKIGGYNENAHLYDFYNETVGIPDQQVILKLLSTRDLPKDTPICDFGCGTGQTARDLTKAGFTNFTGIDGSDGMLEIARKEGLYKKLHLGMLGVGKLPEELKGRFKIAISTGLFSWGHGPASTFVEMLESLTGEKGDIIIFSIRDDQYEDAGLGYKPALEKLAAEGLITLVAEERYDRYTNINKDEVPEDSFIKPRQGIIVWYEHTGKKA